MTMSISDHEAGERFAEISDRVQASGEPVIVEHNGEAKVAVVSVQDLRELERLRQAEFTRAAAAAARETGDAQIAEPDMDEIVRQVRETRRQLYQINCARSH